MVLGGQQNYWDRDAFYGAVKDAPIDLFLHGDGGAPSEPMIRIGGVPHLTVGARSNQPHPWFAVTASPDLLTFKQMYTNGTTGPSFWLYSKARHTPIQKLQKAKMKHISGGTQSYTLSLDHPIASSRIAGVQFRLKGAPKTRGQCRLVVRPKGKNMGPIGLVLPLTPFGQNDSVITVRIPEVLPLSNQEYDFRHIMLTLDNLEEGTPFLLDEAWIF